MRLAPGTGSLTATRSALSQEVTVFLCVSCAAMRDKNMFYILKHKIYIPFQNHPHTIKNEHHLLIKILCFNFFMYPVFAQNLSLGFFKAANLPHIWLQAKTENMRFIFLKYFFVPLNGKKSKNCPKKRGG